MTENPNVDGPDLEGAGSDQTPVSQKKDGSIAGAPQSSQELLELRQNQIRLEKELKGLQSRQDKNQNEVQRFMEEVKGHVAKGKTLEEAEQLVHQSREAEKKDQLLYQIAERLGVGNSSQTPVAGNNSDATDEAARVLADLELNPNDPEVTALFALKGVEFAKEAGKLAVRKAKQSPPDPSEATALQGGSPAPKPGVVQATEEYKKEMLSAPRGRSGDAQRALAKEKARKAGVPVESITFG